ncbi:MAG TPA: thioredoxin domain-containing protein [Gemmatimonadales bacterium]|nr:thioredoxin domain-containing protein [Gemmatimonadales bacterium]
MSPRLTPPVGARDHTYGPAGARVTLVEYGDFECPHCGAAHPIIKQIQSSLGRDVRVAFRHFPMTKSHPHAQHAAEIAEAAAQQGKFWAMHDLLFAHQDALADQDLVGYAETLGIDPALAVSVLADGRFQRRVRDDFASGVRSGVNGTPTFFINGERYDENVSDLLASLMEATIDVPL